MQKLKNYSRKPVAKKLIERSERPVCPETGGHFKAKWGDSLNAERLAIFAEMPNQSTNRLFSLL
ncbi:hypothetical protein [Pedobacter sp. P26]|uniref:hypothetical protein n=1 Tax=Pedobacter sp. P26 TaxID=3423956 RepID=UPI003D6768B0